MLTESFGQTSQGESVSLYWLENDILRVALTDLGASLVKVLVKTPQNQEIDVVLGYDTATEYELENDIFIGSVVGRHANRIAQARFELDGQIYQLKANQETNNLHSGPDFYRTRRWHVVDGNETEVTFELVSPDQDQGFPGELTMRVTYRLIEGVLSVSFTGLSTANTIFNPTHHSYFNLNGHDSGTVLGHYVKLNAQAYTPVHDNLAIPTGEIKSVIGTPFDFTHGKTLGKDIDSDDVQLEYAKGYDHNFVLGNRVGELTTVGTVTGEQTRIQLTVKTTLPGCHLYTGNFISERTGKGGAIYRERTGVCLETQFFPNAINTPGFTAPILLAKQPVIYETEFCFTTH
ncbi:galactose-1-epimerase [Vagococcus penaei]|uniref:Aldose 1-epimerase n=1 Tax=Vagococcus penaei TaxID=633807 RepID=A0A1Q2D7D8_9ENTE|nr:aldose epimerase family protein [Vagococcus penaei]AQP54215.1 hypothetical protein BW732_08260 [Vagococcus penaei]RST99999.1 galactose-1-epimerase [Vagococcus penaei]